MAREWTTADLVLLERHWAAGKLVKPIARALKRGAGDVLKAAREHGIATRWPRGNGGRPLYIPHPMDAPWPPASITLTEDVDAYREKNREGTLAGMAATLAPLGRPPVVTDKVRAKAKLLVAAGVLPPGRLAAAGLRKRLGIHKPTFYANFPGGLAALRQEVDAQLGPARPRGGRLRAGRRRAPGVAVQPLGRHPAGGQAQDEEMPQVPGGFRVHRPRQPYLPALLAPGGFRRLRGSLPVTREDRTMKKILLTIATVALLAGCTATDFYRDTTTLRPAYTGPVKELAAYPPEGTFERVGLVVVRGGYIHGSDTMREALVAKVRAVGGNAVVVGERAIRPDAPFMHQAPVELTGAAIWLKP